MLCYKHITNMQDTYILFASSKHKVYINKKKNLIIDVLFECGREDTMQHNTCTK